MLTPLGLTPSFGFGDRLGLATPGHIKAVKGTTFAPVFAQQSVRENTRTGRTPQQVLDDAQRAVAATGWDTPWGADADHLKSVDDLPAFVEAGYTFFTVDPGEYVDNTADTDSLAELRNKVHGEKMDELSTLYLSNRQPAWVQFDEGALLRAQVKYGRAIEHAATIYQHLCNMKENFDFEVSVDETDLPTTPLEHFFIAGELARLGVKFTSLAPRFVGRFEKGVDYIGELPVLESELAKHAAVTTHFGTYKISLHSGSDKFSIYPLLVKYWGDRLHIKTAGTSYLEALRTLAHSDAALFERIWRLALERYPTDRASYHVSAELKEVTSSLSLPSLLDDFHAREIFHVTYGSALAVYGKEIMSALAVRDVEYTANLYNHFRKHLDLLTI